MDEPEISECRTRKMLATNGLILTGCTLYCAKVRFRGALFGSIGVLKSLRWSAGLLLTQACHLRHTLCFLMISMSGRCLNICSSSSTVSTTSAQAAMVSSVCSLVPLCGFQGEKSLRLDRVSVVLRVFQSGLWHQSSFGWNLDLRARWCSRRRSVCYRTSHHNLKIHNAG